MTTKRTNPLNHRHLGWAALLIVPAMLGAKGCEVAVVGSECGGLRGEQCDVGQFCDFPEEAVCGAADQPGTCVETPEACTLQLDPVCGCDGQTYGNECEANAAGVSAASAGECTLSSGNACGGLLGLACGDGQFCSFAPDAFCGAADQTGTCQVIPEACTEQFDPVCGCDGQTYGHACAASAAGVSVASAGECAPTGPACGGLLGLSCGDAEFCNFAPDAFCGAADQTGTCAPIPQACTREFNPVCGCDGQTYATACVANAAGVSVASPGECGASGGNACGGLLGLSCAEGEFCNFAPEASCGAADQTGTCTAIPDACDDILAPVCGCDDQTYDNRCAANAAGVSVVSEGACAQTGTACGGLLGLQCQGGELCDFALDAICGAADQTGLCRPIPEACTFEFNPVCGCDDQTYGNRCAANAAGVSVASLGECP